MSTLTIAELQDSLNIPLNPTTTEDAGAPLVFDYFPTANLKVDQEYQRLLSKQALIEYGTLKRDRLVPGLVSVRPKSCGDFSGYYLIDGQHKGMLQFCSGLEDLKKKETQLPCMVKYWPDGTSLEDIRKGEAELWYANNVYRKQTSKVDKYRAGVMFGDDESLVIQTYLVNLNLVIDNFGSDDGEALELFTPNPFFYTVMQDLSGEVKNINQAQAGLNLYKKIYDPVKIQGQCFRTMALLKDFMERGLSNGRQREFKLWIVKPEGGLSSFFNPMELIKNFGAFAGPRYILHDRIIPTYNSYMKRTHPAAESVTLGDESLARAARIDKKFSHPEAA